MPFLVGIHSDKPMSIPRLATTYKHIGETPLVALERYRQAKQLPDNLPMAYAGRLDPMASGSLLLLLGDTCKEQELYHDLDKAYDFSVTFGLTSDTYDVLGRLEFAQAIPKITQAQIETVCRAISNKNITLPYPIYSSKTVAGKPLHTWALENRLAEITIPQKTSRIYKLHCYKLVYKTGQQIYKEASDMIESIPPVTDARKSLGADFRRQDVRQDWQRFLDRYSTTEFPAASFRCVVSSGTYVRSLSIHLAEKLETIGLASSITRTHIGRYQPIWGAIGWWRKLYK